MLRDLLLFLVILNPFAQMVYLGPLMEDSSRAKFRRIYFYASIISLCICALFCVSGEFLLREVFQVSMSAMQVFGGLVILGVAYAYIVRGPEGIRLFRGEVAEVAQQIALPLIIGPGVLWMSIRTGQHHTTAVGLGLILVAMVINLLSVYLFHFFYAQSSGKREIGLRKYFSIAMRVNALLMGAVAVQMILAGLRAEGFGTPL